MVLQIENRAENELVGLGFIGLEVLAQEMGEFQPETHAAAGGILDPGQQAAGFFQLLGGQLVFIVQVLEGIAQPAAELVLGQQQLRPEGRDFLGREFLAGDDRRNRPSGWRRRSGCSPMAYSPFSDRCLQKARFQSRPRPEMLTLFLKGTVALLAFSRP